jgi:hypothetical protein
LNASRFGFLYQGKLEEIRSTWGGYVLLFGITVSWKNSRWKEGEQVYVIKWNGSVRCKQEKVREAAGRVCISLQSAAHVKVINHGLEHKRAVASLWTKLEYDQTGQDLIINKEDNSE